MGMCVSYGMISICKCTKSEAHFNSQCKRLQHIHTHTHSHCSINIWRCLVFILILTTVFLHFPMHTAWCSSCLASRDFKWSHRGESAAVWMHQHKMLMWNDVIRSVVGSIYAEANQQQSEFQMNSIHYALTPNLLTLWDYITLRIYLLYVYGENVILLAHTFELMLMHLQKWYHPLRSWRIQFYSQSKCDFIKMK